MKKGRHGKESGASGLPASKERMRSILAAGGRVEPIPNSVGAIITNKYGDTFSTVNLLIWSPAYIRKSSELSSHQRRWDQFFECIPVAHMEQTPESREARAREEGKGGRGSIDWDLPYNSAVAARDASRKLSAFLRLDQEEAKKREKKAWYDAVAAGKKALEARMTPKQKRLMDQQSKAIARKRREYNAARRPFRKNNKKK